MGKLNLTDLDMMAMFRVALEVARTDGNLTDNDFKVLDKYLQPLNMNENRTERLIKAAMMMDYQDAIEALKEMGPELKQYASNFMAEIILSDGEVGDAENDAYDRILDCCGLPFTTIGQENNDGANTNTAKYTVRELCAIETAFDVVWNGNDTGLDLRMSFRAQYDVYNEEDYPSDEENDTKDVDIAARVLKAMSDEKKEEVSQLLSDIVVARDPDEDLMCGEDQVLGYYKFVTEAEMPDLLSDRTLDYKSRSQGGTLPDGMELSILDIYMVFNWLSDRCTYGTYIDFDKLNSFIGAFYMEPVVLFMLYSCEYLPFVNVLNDYDVADRLTDLGENEQLFISGLMADYITEGTDLDNQSEAVSAYEWLFEEYGFPNELDENKLSKVEVHEATVTTDLFIDGVSCTKIKVTFAINDQKDASCRCFATFYHAKDDTPCPEKSIYYLDGELTAQKLFYPSYDSSKFTDFEIDIPNDVLPLNEELYAILRFCNDDDPAGTYIGTYNKKLYFTPTKNEYDPDEALLEETYMVVRYNKSRNYFFETVPDSSYTPCTVDFVTIPLGKTLNDVVKIKDLRYKDADKTPDLNAISRSLDLSLPNRDDMTLAILFDAEGATVPNPLQSLAGNVASESMIICLRTPDGYVSGFVKRRQLRDVLVAFEKHIDRDRSISGILASNKSFNDSMEAKRLVTRKFWSEINSSFYQLKYRVKKSRSVIEVSNKSAQIEKVSYNPNVMINGVSCTRFTLNFVVNGCKGVKCTCECTIRDGGKNHMAISCDEIKYCGYFEHICLHQEFTPGYDSTRYSEFNVEVPNRILNKWKDLVGLIRVEFFTYDGYAPIKITTSQDFTLKI